MEIHHGGIDAEENISEKKRKTEFLEEIILAISYQIDNGVDGHASWRYASGEADLDIRFVWHNVSPSS
jgi:hypothetical protein